MREFKNVAAVSGGQTSGFMFRKLLDKHPDYRNQFVTLFCNTGLERNETLEFLHQMETEWEVPIVWLEYRRVPANDIPSGIFPTNRRNLNLEKAKKNGLKAHWFRVVDYKTAHRLGQPNAPFDELLRWAGVLPNINTRACSVQLKIRTMERYLFSQKIYEYSDHIGIRADEAHRREEILANSPDYTHPKFPLIDDGTTKQDVNRFWNSQKFKLQLKEYEGNCTLCYLKAKWKRVLIAREHPEQLKWWLDWEKKFARRKTVDGDGKYFNKSQPFDLIEALTHQEQLEFKVDDSPDIPCSCASRGFNGADPNEV